MNATLSVERRVFEEHKAELLARGMGKYALVYGEDVIGVYSSEEDAINEGYRRFGNVPFLVKQIVEVEVPEQIVSNLLSL